MAAIIYTVILIVSFLFLAWKKDEAESYFPLKIIGYFILGSFAFNFNQIPFPIGFIVYLLFFRPKLNVNVKRMASVFGVLAFILVHWILPFAIHEWESRPIFIEHELGSVYTMNFQDEYEQVKQELELENNNLRLEDFEVNYVKDGSITDLSWQLLGQNGNSYNLYQIRYDIVKSRYQVTNSQLDTWLQYNRLIEADHFFENLNVLDIKEITHAKGDFSSYVIQSTGERINYAIKNRTHFFISNGEIQLLDDEQLPVEGYYISTFAIKKTGEKRDDKGNITQESFEGTESSDYLFDINIGEK
ncbi:hypothetical protein DFO73_1326 [Cytobacillus oceanisediminis]|uniref:Uncharacterized protein n=1 Tax=Cytobacillus oceanisediminis TaxID=665099 RepID=A0A2V2ZDS1_9BACI|nr:hypothetical protein [Cytobacillus oceanisediminis]PWW17076.1 hypothetical protein DFO73_1326 [Cytobacillus oceanisediminis]